jgi:SAM-dependent methyltransferase
MRGLLLYAAACVVVLPGAMGATRRSMEQLMHGDGAPSNEKCAEPRKLFPDWRCKDATETAREQYKALPYPPRKPEDEVPGLKPYFFSIEMNPATISHMVFGGKPVWQVAESRPFRILVAGGGTGDSTVNYAQTFKNADIEVEITHFDLSAASIAIAKGRLKKRGLLQSTTFVEGNLLNQTLTDTLGKFDYVDTVGVLHHFHTPVEPLKVLSSLLEPHGGIYLMLYGELGRTGVYHFQDMYHSVDLQEDPETARKLVDQLPSTNWLKRNKQILAGDLTNFGDSGIYDLLLHQCDHSFRVSEIVELAKAGGMRILDFLQLSLYTPSDAMLDVIGDKFTHWLQLAQFAELAHGNIHKHHFYLGKEGAATATGVPADGDTVVCWSTHFIGGRFDMAPEAKVQAERALSKPNVLLDFTDDASNKHKGQHPLIALILPLTDCHTPLKAMLPLLPATVELADVTAAVTQFLLHGDTSGARVWYNLKGPLFRKRPKLDGGVHVVQTFRFHGKGVQSLGAVPTQFSLSQGSVYAAAPQQFQLLVFVDGRTENAKEMKKLMEVLTKVNEKLSEQVLVLYVRSEDPANAPVMQRFLVKNLHTTFRVVKTGMPVQCFRPRALEELALTADALVTFMENHLNSAKQTDWPSVIIHESEAV